MNKIAPESEKKYCLQCGAVLLLNVVPDDPRYPQGSQAAACSACHSRVYNVPGNKILELEKLNDELFEMVRRANIMQDAADKLSYSLIQQRNELLGALKGLVNGKDIAFECVCEADTEKLLQSKQMTSSVLWRQARSIINKIEKDGN